MTNKGVVIRSKVRNPVKWIINYITGFFSSFGMTGDNFKLL